MTIAKQFNSLIIPSNHYRNIRSIASQHGDRVIVFAEGKRLAVVIPTYFGGAGYSCHSSDELAIKKSREMKDYPHYIVDIDGNCYEPVTDYLVKVHNIFEEN